MRLKGYVPKGETIRIEDWDVQFLPPTSHLTAEALEQARAIEIGGVPTTVFTAEHLMAICLAIGRPKDSARVVQFVEQRQFDEVIFSDILSRHGLEARWRDFQRKFSELS